MKEEKRFVQFELVEMGDSRYFAVPRSLYFMLIEDGGNYIFKKRDDVQEADF